MMSEEENAMQEDDEKRKNEAALEEEEKPVAKPPEKPKELYQTPKPVATVPEVIAEIKGEKPKGYASKITISTKPETVSGIDVTANMDAEQKERFKKIHNKAQVIPQILDTERDFCVRHRELREKRNARLARG